MFFSCINIFIRNSLIVLHRRGSLEATSEGAATVQVVECLIHQDNERRGWSRSSELGVTRLTQVLESLPHRTAEDLGCQFHLHLILLVLHVQTGQLVGSSDPFKVLKFIQRLVTRGTSVLLNTC